MEEYREIYERKLKSMDEILHQISCMDQAEDEEQLSEVIPLMLKAVGEYTSADRVYVFEWTSETHAYIKNTFEWCGEGIVPQIENLQDISADFMPRWMEIFLKKQSVVIHNAEEAREKYPQEYQILKPQGIFSLIAVPVYSNRGLTGFIGLDNPDLDRDDVSINLLSDVGGHLGCVRENLRMIRMLEKEHSNLEKSLAELQQALESANLNSEIVDSISKLYWLIYRMDLTSGTYEEISAGQEMHRLTGKHGNTEEVFREARETIVASEYQERMREFMDTTTLSDRLRDTESIAMEYCAVSGSWHQARFIVKKRDQEGNVTNVLYVVRQIDKEKQLELKYDQELLEHNRVLSGLSLDYTIAFVLNLDTDEYKIIFNQKTNHAKNKGDVKKFADYVEEYAESFAIPESKEAMKLELGCNRIKERFETEDEYHFSFETIPNAAGLSCFQAHIVKEYDGGGHFAFLGFRSVDEVIKQERFYKEALEKANQALQKQLDMITFALPGGVKISNDDESYSFKYVSEQFAHMLGYETPEELMQASGGTIVGLAHPDDLETGIAAALAQYEKADHYEITYRMKCKDGSWKYIEDRGHKFCNPEGVIEHWNLILDQN